MARSTCAWRSCSCAAGTDLACPLDRLQHANSRLRVVEPEEFLDVTSTGFWVEREVLERGRAEPHRRLRSRERPNDAGEVLEASVPPAVDLVEADVVLEVGLRDLHARGRHSRKSSLEHGAALEVHAQVGDSHQLDRGIRIHRLVVEEDIGESAHEAWIPVLDPRLRDERGPRPPGQRTQRLDQVTVAVTEQDIRDPRRVTAEQRARGPDTTPAAPPHEPPPRVGYAHLQGHEDDDRLARTEPEPATDS